jgi:predicted choloylglycine hydrolase
MKTITIDMCERDLKKRFAPFSEYGNIKELVESTFEEFGIEDALSEYKIPIQAVNLALKWYSNRYCKEYTAEIKAIADVMQIDYVKMLVVNCYYDFTSAFFKYGSFMDFLNVFKKKIPLMGCTAFAYNSPDGPVLARNLDWDDKDELKDLTVIVNYKARLRKNSFKTVAYPGLSSVFSGVKKGAFAITLNMVESSDKEIDQPATFLIRKVLENAEDFDQAVKMLSEEPILSDCLLMVVGVNNGEMVVIERTPNRYAIRYPENDFLVVTNDYRKLKESKGGNSSGADLHDILGSACTRYDGAVRCLKEKLPETPADAYDILSDPDVFFGKITDQQMVMCPATGFIDARYPVAFSEGMAEKN